MAEDQGPEQTQLDQNPPEEKSEPTPTKPKPFPLSTSYGTSNATLDEEGNIIYPSIEEIKKDPDYQH